MYGNIGLILNVVAVCRAYAIKVCAVSNKCDKVYYNLCQLFCLPPSSLGISVFLSVVVMTTNAYKPTLIFPAIETRSTVNDDVTY